MADLQSPALKQQDLFTTLTAPLQESTRLETVGQIHTKYCSKCLTTKSVDQFYRHKKQVYEPYCKPCQILNSKKHELTKMFVEGKYIPKKHPLHKPGRYKSFGHAAFESLENYSTAKEGQVYILYSPAYPSWCKIGMAVDAEDRLKQFQTSSPYRDYTLIATYDTSDRRKAEKFAHNLLEKRHERRGEWFCIQHPVAVSILELPMREFQ
jgi:hypothetical protein